MPTGDWFRSAAEELDRIAEAVRTGGRGLEARWHEGVATGGRLVTTIDRAVTAGGANAVAVANELASNATECRRRAQVCDTYTAAMAQYRSDVAGYYEDVAAYQADAGANEAAGAPYPQHPAEPLPPASWVSDAAAPDRRFGSPL